MTVGGLAKHPLLFGFAVVGVVGLVLAAMVALVPVFGPDRQLWSVRLGFLAFVSLVAGLAGYVAIGVFEGREGPESG